MIMITKYGMIILIITISVIRNNTTNNTINGNNNDSNNNDSNIYNHTPQTDNYSKMNKLTNNRQPSTELNSTNHEYITKNIAMTLRNKHDGKHN